MYLNYISKEHFIKTGKNLKKKDFILLKSPWCNVGYVILPLFCTTSLQVSFFMRKTDDLFQIPYHQKLEAKPHML